MGANPHASQGSLLACPDVIGEIDAIRERGRRRSIVIDPRRTGTAERADEWLPDHARAPTPRSCWPSCHVLVRRRTWSTSGTLAERDRRRRRGRVEPLAPTSRPSASRPTTGIPAERIRRLAHQLADAERGVVYGRIGTVQPGVRHARQLAGRRRQHPHRPLRRRRAALMFPTPVGRGRSRRSPCPTSRAACPTSVAGAAGCAARPRCSARCRCRASPRRSPRRARVRSGR